MTRMGARPITTGTVPCVRPSIAEHSPFGRGLIMFRVLFLVLAFSLLTGCKTSGYNPLKIEAAPEYIDSF
jgi:hypothetical protein